ncbi:immunoglobulin domain-containing protein [Galbibacter sp.]|uniref:immunoglobulin domain-containing protein n=1 Tax=Galbibacter sp. TaxID=2918471 RepID=UPI003A9112C4
MKSVYCILILLGVYAISTQRAYGQRVYADKQESLATPLLASVTNENNAVDVDTTNYSTLNVSISLVSIGTATQNLQFAGTIKPQPTAPLMIRFASDGSLLGLLDGIEVQRTNNGINNPVGDSYSSNNLLDLLGLLGTEQASDVTVPVPGTNEPADGVRLRISSGLLGLGFSTDLYYAFFITPPTVESPVSVCEGESALISISNFQPGYTYTIYDALTGGNLLLSGTSDVLSFSMEGRTTGTYYIEAVEGETEFASSRTAFTITIYPKPGNPDIDLNVNQN